MCGKKFSSATSLPPTAFSPTQSPSRQLSTCPLQRTSKESRRFLGTINYLSKFCPLLSTVTQPLRNLTKDDVQFLWSAKHQHAFDAAKALATSAPCLTYYDVTAPVILQPSKHQESCTLDESCLQPVVYSSKRLTPTEQRYVQIERECLAIVEAFCKFDQWLLGKSDITVHTDHKPPQSIFQKDVASAPKRLDDAFPTTIQLRSIILERFFTTLGRYPVQSSTAR